MATAAAIDHDSLVTILRLKRNGERVELPVWTSRYEQWLAEQRSAPTTAPQGSSKGKKGQKDHRRKGTRRGGDSDSGDDDAASAVADLPQASIADDKLVMMVVDQRKVIFNNCSKRDPASRKVLRAAFGTEDLMLIARVILAIGGPVETDGVRQARQKDLKTKWAQVLAHVADEGMLLHRFADAPMEPADVRTALVAGQTSGATTESVNDDVFDDPFIEMTCDSATNGASDVASRTKGVLKESRSLLSDGVDAWLVAAHLAAEACSEVFSNGAPMCIVPDALRRCSVARLTVHCKREATDEYIEKAQLCVNLLIAALDGLLWAPTTLPKHEEASATTAVLLPATANTLCTKVVVVDSAFAASQQVQQLLRTASGLSDPQYGWVSIDLAVIRPLTMLTDATWIVGFTERVLDVRSSAALFPKERSAPVATAAVAAHPTPPQRPEKAPAIPDKACDRASKPTATRVTAESLELRTHADLQAQCKKQGLGTGGKKKDLIARLLAAAAENGGDGGSGSGSDASS